MTEWSTTSSTGTSGLMRSGTASERLRSHLASRRGPRCAGTPVRSCISTLSGLKPISPPTFAPPLAALATASTSAAWTFTPSSWRRRFSSRTFRQYGSLSTSKRPASASSRCMLSVRSPTVIVALDAKLSDARTGVGDMQPSLLPRSFGSRSFGKLSSLRCATYTGCTASGASTNSSPPIHASASQTCVTVEPPCEQVRRNRRRRSTDHERSVPR